MKNTEYISRGQIPIYLSKMDEGDLNARNKLIEHYTKNVTKYIEKHYSNTNCPKEDLIQTAILAIIKVLNTYKTNDICFFNTKLHHHLNLEINKQVKLFENNYIEETKDDKFDFENIENLHLIKESIKKLSKKKQDIIYLYFFKGYSFIEIAKLFNFGSHQYVHKTLNESLYFIKQDIMFNFINFENKSNVLNNINKYLDDIQSNNEEKIELFNKYISLQNEKVKRILLLYFYNDLSIIETAKLFNTEKKYIESIIKKFIIYIETKINKRNEFNKLLGVESNSALNLLYDELDEYSEVEIKSILQQLLINDKILLDRLINCKNIEIQEKLKNIILNKIKTIIKTQNKKIVKIKN